MFPNSLLFAFVATCLFLANVGAEAGSAPNRPDGFDSYPSDHFRKARMDKRYIPHSVFQGYQAKAKRDGRVFVRRSDDEYGGSRPEFQPAEFEKRSVGEDADDGIGGHWSIAKRNDEDDGDKGLFNALNKRSLPPTAAANLEKRSPLEISMPFRTVGTVQKAQQPTPSKYSQGPDLVGPTYQLPASDYRSNMSANFAHRRHSSPPTNATQIHVNTPFAHIATACNHTCHFIHIGTHSIQSRHTWHCFVLSRLLNTTIAIRFAAPRLCIPQLYQAAPSSITIASLLSATPADRQGGDSSFSSVQEFINQAQKTTKCTWLSPADVHCAFCKRCSDAGGKNGEEFNCPDDSDSAETKVEEKKK
ncbi:hypothetical protein NDA10_006449 [Ustilago hordei]|nr:hypothetical protein NDA10_006449 [Ustilago hordei]